ncbi:hypothetical protein [Arthrobacter sp. zg-Y1110]|uniref:hypothetical protein n=1 Tax=Arthrobacter sp. zg-Y1110 TaxID=2886932 RepID=UPI001D151475|nr:hypothetical protein [Arthrobacter sp. zg-Y1110]MCC3292473.1 hypothetical protein [Arthrobacter sp. zg-Y1110]UWX87094.1 hypothetical protein N2K99_17235 [Arthrobacter sp. zg-Y1110]
MTNFNDVIPELNKLGVIYTEAEIFDEAEIAANPVGDRIGTGPFPEMAAYVVDDAIEIIPIHNRAVVTFAGKSAEAIAEEVRAAVELLRTGQTARHEGI